MIQRLTSTKTQENDELGYQAINTNNDDEFAMDNNIS